jgi:hypothetical protein
MLVSLLNTVLLMDKIYAHSQSSLVVIEFFRRFPKTKFPEFVSLYLRCDRNSVNYLDRWIALNQRKPTRNAIAFRVVIVSDRLFAKRQCFDRHVDARNLIEHVMR